MKKLRFSGITTLAAIIVSFVALSLTACPPESDPEPTHTHDYGTAWKSNATQHWHECSCGDRTDVATHEWQWVVTTPATTEADGLETETCSTCGETRGTKPIAKLPPDHTHTYATTWTNDAIQHWKECTANDGAKTDVADHDWGNWQETTPPTITEDGVETRTCTTCGEKEKRSGATALASPFFGTWINTGGSEIITINASLFKWTIVGIDEEEIVNNPVWTAKNNDDIVTQNEYTSGYILSGTNPTENYSVFINADKNKICIVGGPNSHFYFNKQ